MDAGASGHVGTLMSLKSGETNSQPKPLKNKAETQEEGGLGVPLPTKNFFCCSFQGG